LEQTGRAIAIDDAPSSGTREFQIQWRSAQATAGSARVERLQIVKRIEHNMPPPRQRSSELAKDQLVVVVHDRQGTIRYSQIIMDPD